MLSLFSIGVQSNAIHWISKFTGEKQDSSSAKSHNLHEGEELRYRLSLRLVL